MVWDIWILSLTQKKEIEWNIVLFPKKQGSLLLKFIELLIIIFTCGM